MSIKKRLFSLALAVTMVLTLVPLSDVHSSASYPGELQFNANGKFTVMQLSDIHAPLTGNINPRTITLITNMIARYNPDLIVFLGDSVPNTITIPRLQSIIDSFTQPLINAGVPYAVTFGNHDDEGSNPSKDTQYNYYKTRGGNLFIDHDVTALTGAGSGVIPIYQNGQTSGDPAFQVYVMDSGSGISSYNCPYTDQIDYYIQRSQTYPDVPSLWFMHIIIPDVYTECMSTTYNPPGYSGYSGSSNKYLIATRINWAKSGMATTLAAIYKERPCPAEMSTYKSAAHRSSSAYGSKTLYESWVAYGNMLGSYYGHDHKNSFVSTTSHGIDIGFGKSPGLDGYNDGNPGARIYELDINGTYASYNVTESDLLNPQVFFDPNGGAGEMTPQFIQKNTTKALKDNAYSKTGATFLGWATSPTGNVVYANKASYSIGTSDIRLYAKWDGVTSDITFNANGGTGGIGPTSMNIGQALTAPTVTRTGYTFTGWSPNVPATVPANNTTYVAQWTPINYTITFDANGGTGGTQGQKPCGAVLTAPVIERTGYTFTGWSPSVPSTVPATDTTYTAQWSINNYTIIFDSNSGTGGAVGSFQYGAALVAPYAEREGYVFTGWLPPVPSTVPGADTTFVAQWAKNNINIIFDANGGTGGTGPTGMTPGAELVAPTVLRTGYTFTGWSPAVPSTVPEAATTYTAQWSLLGDINADSAITASDALMTLKSVSGSINFSDLEKLAADVNRDGSVTASDALMILKFVSGSITSF